MSRRPSANHFGKAFQRRVDGRDFPARFLNAARGLRSVSDSPETGRARDFATAPLRAARRAFSDAPYPEVRAGRPAGLSFSGDGRYITRVFPICWTGADTVCAQISSIIESLSSRSAPDARILISSCATRFRSISAMTEGVRPEPPIRTTGAREWARARSSRRCAEVMSSMVRHSR